VPEQAELIRTDAGVEPGREGWFVVNAREAAWTRKDEFGSECDFESKAVQFPEYGINIHVLEPGKPNCMYHRESNQEDFLVISGECLLLVEEQEVPLRAWDFVHFPAWTNHVLVGAGSGPCVVVMVGSRCGEDAVVYPVSELARRHGAGVEQETDEPRVAYAPFSLRRRAPYRDGDLPEL
jgi:uncharacterized cupin superfamily protein